MTTISIMSGIALRGAFEAALLPRFTCESGIATEVQWGPTTALMERIAGGERCDVAVLTDAAIAELTANGRVDGESQATLASAVLGIAVREGAAHPDISTEQGFVAALTGARSVAFSRAGASGIYFGKLIDRLGIGERIRERATIIPGGFTAEKLVDGEADIAVQQISELVMVPGVEIVGRFPNAFQSVTTFRAAVFKTTKDRAAAERLVRALVTADAKAAYAAAGLVCTEPL